MHDRLPIHNLGKYSVRPLSLQMMASSCRASIGHPSTRAEEDGPARQRDGGAGARRLPRARGEPAGWRGGVRDEGRLHDGDEDLRQYAAAGGRDGARRTSTRATYMADLQIPNAMEASMVSRPRRVRRRSRRASTPSRSAARTARSRASALLEKWLRDIKVYDIFEGTGNIQRVDIAKGLMPGLKAF